MIKFTYHDLVFGVTKEFIYTIISKHSQHEGNIELISGEIKETADNQ